MLKRIMAPEIVKFDPRAPQEAFARCRAVVSSGGVIAYPTDTFYGLGADPRNAAAVGRLFSIKGREGGRPILLLLSDAAQVQHWSDGISAGARTLMSRFWPGPLTLVMAARPDVLPALTAGTGRIGLRVPGNEVTRLLLAYVGGALTGTSANPSGGPDPRTAADVVNALGGRIDLVLDGGSAAGDLPSTVVDVAGERATIIRQGAIAAEALQL